MPESAVRPRDRSFAPTLLLGLAGGALTAVAGTREWASATGDAAGLQVEAAVTGSDAAPLVTTLALVALAGWGVLLVLRGRSRRIVAAIGLLACAGALTAVVDAFNGAQDRAVDAVIDKGASGDVFVASLGGWYYAAAVGAVIALASFVVALLRSPRWPAMGSRYDAPSARASTPATDEDMWRALDEGRDPTS